MRKANMNDLFQIARLVTKLGIKDDIFEAQKGKEDVEQIGFDVIFKIFEKATTEDIQNEIYEILSAPFEIPKEDIGKLEPDKLIEMCSKCFSLTTVINFIKRVQPMIQV